MTKCRIYGILYIAYIKIIVTFSVGMSLYLLPLTGALGGVCKLLKINYLEREVGPMGLINSVLCVTGLRIREEDRLEEVAPQGYCRNHGPYQGPGKELFCSWSDERRAAHIIAGFLAFIVGLALGNHGYNGALSGLSDVLRLTIGVTSFGIISGSIYLLFLGSCSPGPKG